MSHLAVLGHPVSHSRSPAMQNAALAELGLAPEWTYEAVDVQPNVFEALVAGLPARGFAGVNVTVPHKEAALALADEAGEEAAAIGAANTLTFAEGIVRADNTDAEGFLSALPEPPEGRALVLGAGGTARAVVWALVGAGAEVQIWNRTPERAQALGARRNAALDPRRPFPDRHGKRVGTVQQRALDFDRVDVSRPTFHGHHHAPHRRARDAHAVDACASAHALGDLGEDHHSRSGVFW